ncbi:MAG: hypothetical protein AB8B67_01240 [Rickettsiaceae bacterium]
MLKIYMSDITPETIDYIIEYMFVFSRSKIQQNDEYNEIINEFKKFIDTNVLDYYYETNQMIIDGIGEVASEYQEYFDQYLDF